MRKVTWRQRVAYRVDNFMAWNPMAKIVGLAAVAAALLAVSSLLLTWLAPASDGVFATITKAWIYLLNPTGASDAKTRPEFIVGVTTSVGGMIVVALLVGLVTGGLAEQMDGLKKGRSRVIEHGHTLVLGWNDKILPLLRQLALANDSDGGGVVVILSNREKVAMEDEIRVHIRDMRGTTVVCRSGDTASVSDLEGVAADSARAIVVLSSDEGSVVSDNQAIRTVLALKIALGEPRSHFVVEVNDTSNRSLIRSVGGAKVCALMTHDVTGRLMIQSALQPGLAQVYDALLGFEGSEFYLRAWPALVGKTFDQACRSFSAAVVCGLARSGKVILNPSGDTPIAAGDELVVLAEDDDSYSPGSEAPGGSASLPAFKVPPPAKAQLLMCGWRRDLGTLVGLIDAYIGPGSEMTIMAEKPIEEREALLKDVVLQNVTIRHHVGNFAQRADLEAVDVGRFDSVTVLVDDRFGDDGAAADSHNLISLLLIRDLQTKTGKTNRMLISEIRDPRTKKLVANSKVSDFVLSTEIMSKYLAQVAERQIVAEILEDLLDPEGNELYLKDARLYAGIAEEVSFWDLHVRGRARSEIVVGYVAKDGEITLNPSDKAARRVFGEGDQMVVIAEDAR